LVCPKTMKTPRSASAGLLLAAFLAAAFVPAGCVRRPRLSGDLATLAQEPALRDYYPAWGDGAAEASPPDGVVDLERQPPPPRPTPPAAGDEPAALPPPVTVEPNAEPPPPAGDNVFAIVPDAAETAAPPKLYTVQKGDTLIGIGIAVYGDPDAWRLIYRANRHQLNDPNDVKAGAQLLLP